MAKVWNPDLLRTSFEYDADINGLTIVYGTKQAAGEPLNKLGELTLSGNDINESVRPLVFLHGLSKLVGNKRAQTGVIWEAKDADALVESYTEAFNKLVDGSYWTRGSSEGRALGASDFVKAHQRFYEQAGKTWNKDDFVARYGQNARKLTAEQKELRDMTMNNKKFAKIMADIAAERKTTKEVASDDAI